MTILNWNLTSFKTFSPKWFLSCFSGCDWMMISSVNVITNLIRRRDIKENACYRVSRQMDNCKLPHVNSSLNVWGIALWQHTIFTEVTDRTLWSMKNSRSAVFYRIQMWEKERKPSLVKNPLFFIKAFCEQQECERLKEADTHTASTRYWLRNVTYHNLDTNQNWQCLIEYRISRHVWLKTYLK